MSTVTNIILHTGYDDGAGNGNGHPNVDLLSAWILKESPRNGPLTQIDQHARTMGKVMEAEVFGGGFNYFDKEEFLRFFQTVPWEYKDTVQLLIKEQEEDRFQLYQFDRNDKLVRLYSNFYLPEKAIKLESREITDLLNGLNEYERKQIFSKFCTDCGSSDPACTCMRDD